MLFFCIFVPMRPSFALVVVLTLFVLLGCTGSQYPLSLRIADTLTNTNPDSTVVLLGRMEAEMSVASEPVRRYYQLLRIKADDKIDRMEVSADSIKELVHYFEDRGDKSLLPTAYYYAGRVYSDLNEAPISLNYFQKSLDAMENENIDDQKLKSVIYSQMGYLYLFQYIYDEAERCFRASYDIGVEINDTASIFWGLRDLGTTYQWQKKYKECQLYLNKAHDMAVDANNLKMMAHISTDIAYLLNSMGDYVGAMEHIRMPMEYIHLLDSNSVLSLMSAIYYNANETDSFLNSANLVEQVGDAFSKEKLYDRLTNYYFNQGELDSAKIFQNKYKVYSDSANTLIKSGELQKVHSLYSIHKEEERSAELKIHRLILGIAFLVSAIGLMAVLLYFYLSRRRYVERRKRFKMLQREINLQNDLGKKKEVKNREFVKKTIKSSPVYDCILDRVKSFSKLNNQEWQDVEAIIKENYPDFKERLYDVYDLSSYEYQLCLLIKMDVPPSSMAILTSHTLSAVSQARKRLYKKYFRKEGTGEQWDVFIRSL